MSEPLGEGNSTGGRAWLGLQYYRSQGVRTTVGAGTPPSRTHRSARGCSHPWPPPAWLSVEPGRHLTVHASAQSVPPLLHPPPAACRQVETGGEGGRVGTNAAAKLFSPCHRMQHATSLMAASTAPAEEAMQLGCSAAATRPCSRRLHHPCGPRLRCSSALRRAFSSICARSAACSSAWALARRSASPAVWKGRSDRRRILGAPASPPTEGRDGAPGGCRAELISAGADTPLMASPRGCSGWGAAGAPSQLGGGRWAGSWASGCPCPGGKLGWAWCSECLRPGGPSSWSSGGSSHPPCPDGWRCSC